jgi:hypothetical protein
MCIPKERFERFLQVWQRHPIFPHFMSILPFSVSAPPPPLKNIFPPQVAPPFEELIANMSHVRVARTLNHLEMFKILTEQQRSQLSLLVEFREYQPRHVLLRQHEAVSGLYIVLAGSLEQSVHDEQDNVEIDLGDIEPGMVVGEISLLAGVEAHATITVKEKWFVAHHDTLLFHVVGGFSVVHCPDSFDLLSVSFV